jgi:hypothetical protein
MTAEPNFTVFYTLNGLVETSMRLLVVLERFHGIGLSLEELRLADFFVVFTEDIGGPSSLHVPLSNRAGSFTIRGDHYLPSALTFLQRADQVTLEGRRHFATHASEDTPFTSQYLTALSTRPPPGSRTTSTPKVG